MNKPRMYHTLRARWETAKDLVQKGKTAEASDQNQLSITEALIEILAALDDIADTLKSWAPGQKAPAAQPKPSNNNPAEGKGK